MARYRPPDHLPADVLTRPDFQAACADRDLGAIFAIAAKYGGRGFTRSHIARRCEMGISRVIDYIEGRTQAEKMELFERVSDGLHIPGAMLGVSPRDWEESGNGAVLESQREQRIHQWIVYGCAWNEVQLSLSCRCKNVVHAV